MNRSGIPGAIRPPRGRVTAGCGLLVALLTGCGQPVALAQSGESAASPDFARDIRPLLADYCYACHGPDSATREAGFRLDQRDSATGPADSGDVPVVPGDPQASQILQRIRSADDGFRMPPPEFGKQLSAAQTELLEQWIRDGAVWQDHWAFIPPRRPALPEVSQPAWPRNPIDRFVMSRLDRHGLSPSPQADPVTLVRRLYLDLTGLPPDPAEVDRFLADTSAGAWQQLVDRLLDSPRYGEHMASFWLDGARFADTNGYQNDFRRSMWLWRDWVIQACNDNMPFDQFAIEQLAGDMLPDATLQQKIASGFNRNHRTNTEGGSINEEWLVENVVDRVETTSTLFLGLTMGCARCHDHKFDPLTQQEFYRFFAYFNNIEERGVYEETRGNVPPLIQVETAEYREQLEPLRKRIAEQETALTGLESSLAAFRVEWEAALRGRTAGPLPEPELRIPDGARGPVAKRLRMARRSHRFGHGLTGPWLEIEAGPNRQLDLGDAWDFDASRPFTVSAWVNPRQYGAIVSRMDAASAYRGFDMLMGADGRMSVHLIHQWPGNATKVTTARPIPLNHWTHVTVASQPPGKAGNIAVWFNGQPVAVTVDADTLDGPTRTDHPLWLGLRAHTTPFAGRISAFQIRDQRLAPAEVAELHERSLRSLLERAGRERTAAQQAEIVHQYHGTHPGLAAAAGQLQESRRQLSELESQVPTTMVMAERSERRPTWVLKRGQYDQPDRSRPVQPGVPALFAAADPPPANRLELARWLVDGHNPLTARVAVNHIWSRYFGIGLLETPENFGVQAPLPSHPRLLDWLASEFVESGWDVKGLHRLIVNSATYRQSSRATPQQFAADPDNRLLSRGSRFRLPAESIRDNALAISGLLSPRIGGPSVKPWQPDGLWDDLAGGAREPAYQMARDEDLYRRSLYIYRKRTVPHPTMSSFDGSSREVCVVARGRTNTPLQALALLNDMTYVEAARQLAIRAMDHSEQTGERIRHAFRCATCRVPGERESELLAAALQRYREEFRTHPDQAGLLVAQGLQPPPQRLDPVELAAFTTLAGVILNLDEVITRE